MLSGTGARVSKTMVGGKPSFRVRIGPFQNVGDTVPRSIRLSREAITKPQLSWNDWRRGIISAIESVPSAKSARPPCVIRGSCVVLLHTWKASFAVLASTFLFQVALARITTVAKQAVLLDYETGEILFARTAT